MRIRILQFVLPLLVTVTVLGTDNRAAGAKLFARHCAECHGPAGEGTDRAPSVRLFVRSTAPQALQSFIKNGNLRAGMPSWSRLPDQQLSQIVTYLQNLEP